MKRRRSKRNIPRRLAGGLVSMAAAAGLTGAAGYALTGQPGSVPGQGENLINRISNVRMAEFEGRLSENLILAIARYISKKQYVLAVKVIWNPEVVPLIQNPELSPEQQKLPGFPIFVRAPGSPAVEGGTPPFVRLEVKVLIDETLPEYYERFVRKIVPIVARLDFNRGDQVVVLKETFPVLQPEDMPPPTLPEKELMRQFGQAPPPGALPPGFMLPVPRAAAVPAPVFSPQAATSPAQAAQIAYDERRLRDSLRIVQSAFQRATTNRERSFYLGMEGSIYYTMDNHEAAKSAWRRAVTYDPTNMEVQEVLSHVDAPTGEEVQ